MSMAFQICLKTMKLMRFKLGFAISEIGGSK